MGPAAGSPFAVEHVHHRGFLVDVLPEQRPATAEAGGCHHQSDLEIDHALAQRGDGSGRTEIEPDAPCLHTLRAGELVAELRRLLGPPRHHQEVHDAGSDLASEGGTDAYGPRRA